ncbi:MAG: peptidylprolyl isomerase [Oscillospiraceae bacterium]|nr:peptidylprolyl isomerase [Oscillospiraceae bacterium]
MKKIKQYTALSAILALVLTILTTGCSFARQKSAIVDYDYSEMQLIQLDAFTPESAKALAENRPVVVITTSLGEIRLVLFPEYAPDTVAEFIAAVEEGFYDDTEVLAIKHDEDDTTDAIGAFFQAGMAKIDDGFMVRTASDGTIIETPNEYSVNMWSLKGAIGAYSGDKHGVSDSRFFIVNQQPLGEERLAKMRGVVAEDGSALLPEELVEAFDEYGGVFTLSGFYTIFGQTIEGFDVIEAICDIEVNERTRPVEDIKIISVKMEEIQEIEDES